MAQKESSSSIYCVHNGQCHKTFNDIMYWSVYRLDEWSTYDFTIRMSPVINLFLFPGMYWDSCFIPPPLAQHQPWPGCHFHKHIYISFTCWSLFTQRAWASLHSSLATSPSDQRHTPSRKDTHSGNESVVYWQMSLDKSKSISLGKHKGMGPERG